jgi:hypothetical protein
MQLLSKALQYITEPVNCAVNLGMKLATDVGEFVLCVISNITGG